MEIVGEESIFMAKIASKALSGSYSAEPAKSFAPAFSKSSAPNPVFLSLFLLVGIVSLLFWLGGGRRLGRRTPAGQRWRSEDPAGVDRQGEDPLLPPEPPTLLPRSHHEILHDRRYLRRILKAELEGPEVDEARPADSPPQVEPSEEVGSSQADVGTSQGQGSPGSGENGRL